MEMDTRKVLEESELRYKTLFDTSRDAVMIVIPSGKFIDGNKATLEIFGCKTKDEFLSKTPADLSPEYQPDGSKSDVKSRQMMDNATSKGSHYFQWVHKRVNGEIFSATVLLSRMEISGRTILQATVRDISEQEKVEVECAQLAAIVESSDDAIIGKTLEGVIFSWNKGAEKLYGYSAKETAGKNISLIMPTDRQNEMAEFLKEIRSGRAITHFETVRHTKDGRRIDVLLTLSPIKDHTGKIIGASSIGHDISGQKKIEEELKAKVENLERFQKITVDRELKMKELKEKIAELENRLAGASG